jgi:hypothetical protein
LAVFRRRILPLKKINDANSNLDGECPEILLAVILVILWLARTGEPIPENRTIGLFLI